MGRGTEGIREGQCALPIGVAVSGGEVVVCDFSTQCVQVFELDGAFVRQFELNMRWEGEGQFQLPWHVAVSDHGEVFICDLGNHCIQVFR